MEVEQLPPATFRSNSSGISANAESPTSPKDARQRRPTISNEPVVNTSVTTAARPRASTSRYNPYLYQTEKAAFPTPGSDVVLLPEDARDDVLNRICVALASVNNRLLCPKEIAEVMMYQGWNCTGAQPFAIVSTCIRAHLRRKNHALAAVKDDPQLTADLQPLLWLHELNSVVSTEDRSLMGINPDADLAVKRGILWYLSPRAGYKSPFGDRDPNFYPKLQPVAPIEKFKIKPKPIVTRRTSVSSGSAYAFDPESSRQASPDDDDAMGRGKRKRKASAIAGGDSSWQAASPTVPNVILRAPTALNAIQEDNRLRRAESSESALATPTITSTNLPFTSQSAPTTQQQPRSLKVRLSVNRQPVLSRPTDTDNEIDDEDDDATHGEADIVAMERRRFKKRSRSEGSLLALSHGPQLDIHRSGNSSILASLRPPLFLERKDSEDSYPTSSSVPATIWSSFRPFYDSTSIASSADLQQRLHEDDYNSADEMDLDTLVPGSARLAVAESDFHESMLHTEFDFQFDLASAAAAQPSADSLRVSRLTVRQSPFSTPSPDIDDDVPPFVTPSTTPRSSISSIKAEEDGQYDKIAESVNFRHFVGTAGPVIQAIKAETDAALTAVPDSFNLESQRSPAGELPVLPLITAAHSSGFAPAKGISKKEDEDPQDHAVSSRSASVEADAPLSPLSSFASPLSPRSLNPSGAASPAQYSDSGSFDPERMISPFGSRSPEQDFSPFHMEEDDFASTFGDGQDEEELRVDIPELIHIDELSLDWGEDEPAATSSKTFVSPFGPESFGFSLSSAAIVKEETVAPAATDKEDEVMDDLAIEDCTVESQEPILIVKRASKGKVATIISEPTVKASKTTKTAEQTGKSEKAAPPAKRHSRRLSARNK